MEHYFKGSLKLPCITDKEGNLFTDNQECTEWIKKMILHINSPTQASECLGKILMSYSSSSHLEWTLVILDSFIHVFLCLFIHVIILSPNNLLHVCKVIRGGEINAEMSKSQSLSFKELILWHFIHWTPAQLAGIQVTVWCTPYQMLCKAGKENV